MTDMADNPHSRSAPADRVALAEQVYDMRLLGWSLRKIAEEMTRRGHRMSHETVRQLEQEQCDRVILPKVEAFVKQSVEQLDIAIVEIMAQIQQGKSVARNAEVLAKLQERKSRFFGADKPTQTEQTITIESESDRAIKDLIAEIELRDEESIGG